MRKLQNIIRDWAIADGNPTPQFRESDDGVTSSYGFTSSGEHSTYNMFVDCNEKTEIVSAFAYAPMDVPEHRRDEIAELLVRLNRMAVMGNFDLDFSDGEIRYRAAVDVEGGELTQRMIENLIGVCVWRWEKHFETIMEVAFGDTPACVAVSDGHRGSNQRVLQ